MKTDNQHIKALLDKYDHAQTTADEERLLAETFQGDQTGDLTGDAAYFKALHQLQRPAEGAGTDLAARLSRQVDQWNVVEKTSGSRARRMSLRVVSMVAASLLLLFSLGLYLNNRKSQPAMMVEQQTDTFSNPEDAEEAAEKALAKFSLALNKGLNKVNNVNNNHN